MDLKKINSSFKKIARCLEPTCLCLGPWFNLDPCDLWPWPMWPLTSRSNVKEIHDLDMVNVHHHTKFGDPISNGSPSMYFFLVNYSQVLTWVEEEKCYFLVPQSPQGVFWAILILFGPYLGCLQPILDLSRGSYAHFGPIQCGWWPIEGRPFGFGGQLSPQVVYWAFSILLGLTFLGCLEPFWPILSHSHSGPIQGPSNAYPGHSEAQLRPIQGVQKPVLSLFMGLKGQLMTIQEAPRPNWGLSGG